MKILLREIDNKLYALHPEDGEKLTRIENPGVWCDSAKVKTDGYPDEHADGIFFNSLDSAKEKLKDHIIVFD